MQNKYYLFFLVLILSACKLPVSFHQYEINEDLEKLFQRNAEKCNVKSNFCGTVYLLSGNCMPSIVKNNNCKIFSVKTSIVIYPYVKFGDVKTCNETSFLLEESKIVQSVKSDKHGAFSVNLKPGNYSVFVKKDNCFYANYFDGKNGIQPIEIIEGKVSKLNIMIDEAVH